MQSTSFSPLSSPIPLLVCQPSSSPRLHGISHPTRKGTLTPPFSLLALPMRPALRSLAFGPPSNHHLWRRCLARSCSSRIAFSAQLDRHAFPGCSVGCPDRMPSASPWLLDNRFDVHFSLCLSVALFVCVPASPPLCFCLFLSLSCLYTCLFACLLYGLPYYTRTYFTPYLIVPADWGRADGGLGWTSSSVQRERICL